MMNARDLVMRVASHIPGIPSDLFDWWTHSRQIATNARDQRIEDEARITTDPHDMARWIQEPVGRRPRPQMKGAHRGDRYS